KHVVGIAVIGGDDQGAAGCLHTLDNLAEAAIHSFDGRDGSRDDARVANHVGVGEVDHAKSVFAALPPLAKSIRGGLGAHLGLVVVGGNLTRRIDQAVLL